MKIEKIQKRVLQNICGAFFRVSFFVFLFTISLPVQFSAHAVDDEIIDEDLEEELEDLTDDLDELEEKRQKYKGLFDLKNREATEITKQISQINSENAAVESNIKENESDIEEITNDTEKLGTQIAKKKVTIADQQKLLAHMLRSHYEQLSGNTLTSVFFTNEDRRVFIQKDQTVQTGQKMRELVHNTIAIKEQLDADRATLEKKKAEKVDLTYQLEQRTAYLANQRSYKQVLANEITTEKEKYSQKVSKIEAQQLAIQKEIQDLEYAQIGDYSSADLPSANKAGFSRPVKKNVIVTQGYGKTSFSHRYRGGQHNGVDYSGRDDRDVLATGDGTVIATGNMGRYGYGKWIAIDHDNGLVSMYGHLSSVKVSKGDKVDRTDRIGIMGNTGFSTATHLHFTLFVEKTFDVVRSSTVSGLKIPTGATVSPAQYVL